MELTLEPKFITSHTIGEITRREIEILTLIAHGNQTKEIASRLNISAETVKTHLRNIYHKTGAHNRIEALNKTKWLTASLLSTETNC